MRLYNSLTKKIETFAPLKKGQVSLYSCGPTVYERVHIGNLSAFIISDTLRRVLAAERYSLKHVMNFTDVDDKTIRRSQEQYAELAPRPALNKLTQKYSETFVNDMWTAGNDTDNMIFVKATDNIAKMQQLITELYDKKFAYIAEDGVYFSIAAYRNSGKNYGQLTKITTNLSQARVASDEYDKANASDFALWKRQKSGEPAWDFAIDRQNLPGRPGWHIECSAMSSAMLGQPFDIHTGGVDLKFPHHENEIAQSTAGHDDPLYAKFFVHNEHILIDAQKMSKSLNNFFTLADLQNKGYDPLSFRLLVLQAHYRSQVHFSFNNLQKAAERLKALNNMAVLRWQAQPKASAPIVFENEAKNLLSTLQNDLDTPKAMSQIAKVQKIIEANLLPVSSKSAFEAWLGVIDQLFGLQLLQQSDIDQSQKQLIAQRQAARQTKNWAKSDQLRAQLAEQGLGLNDTSLGPIWYRL
ncbi:MAG: cysteine--tRNA ligase [Candidatus Saccharimonadales bacterium]